jgi:hypothetical protein
MAYDYGYKSPGTAINGITKYLQLKHIDLYKSFKKWSDLNEHLKEIRLSQEPKKMPSNSVENNSAYISKNYNFKVVIDYFNNI